MSAPLKSNVCSNCKFFWRYKTETSVWSGKEKPQYFGECWRFPPNPHFSGVYGASLESRHQHAKVPKMITVESLHLTTLNRQEVG